MSTLDPKKQELRSALEKLPKPTAKDQRFFQSFRFLNESSSLPPDLQRNKSAGLRKLSDPILKDKYYVWHCLQTMDTVFTQATAEVIATHLYKGSDSILKAWEGIK